jgi:hypothetical protein
MFDLIGILMDWPIDLDAQPRRRTIEIQDVRTNRVLPSKAQAKLLAAQHFP